MDNYVSLNKILDIVMQYCPDDDGSCSKANIDLREMLDEIEAIEVEDVQPVKHAEWVYAGTFGNLNYHECSYCGNEDFRMYKYCPYCGAVMRNGV